METITEQNYLKLLGWIQLQDDRLMALEKVFGQASNLSEFWEAVISELDVKHKLCVGKITGIRKTKIGYEVRFKGKKWINIDECEVLDV